MKIKTHRLLHWAALVIVAAQTARAATFTVTTTADSGPGSLRDVLDNASDGDTIDATGVSGTILLTGGELMVTNSVTIAGPGPNRLAVDGNAGSRVFYIQSNSIINIYGLTITNGLTTGSSSYGAGIYNGGALTLRRCIISGNTITNSLPTAISAAGGGIFNWGTLTLEHCTLSGNTIPGDGTGGAIFNGFYGTLSISDSLISSNRAFSAAGAIDNYGVVNLARTTITGNSAAGIGGGILNTFGTVTITNCILSGNSTTEVNGGAIYNTGALTLSDSVINDNSAYYAGGAIYNAFGSADLTRTTVRDNTARAHGGGIFNDNYDGTVSIISDCTIGGNSAGGYGGGISSWSQAMLFVQNSTLGGNSAGTDGGAIYSDGGLSIHNCTVSLNNAARQGGGIFDYYSNYRPGVTNSIVSLNTAPIDPDITGSLPDAFNFIGGDPLLGPLADNGGPTMTMALLPGSPCINAGDPNFAGPPDFDQRGPGFARIEGGRVDIGAFESEGDDDHDGAPNSIDECPGTPAGGIVDSAGCSIDQLVPCAGPTTGGAWKNHGEYVSTVVRTAQGFLAAGLITKAQKAAIVQTAAQSDCGKKVSSKQDH